MKLSLPRCTLAALCALGSAAVVPAAHAATPGPKVSEAWFKVTVEGVQTTTWTADHKPAFRCDSSYRGSGSERVTFKSRRPLVVRAFRLGKGPVSFINDGKLAALPTRGNVKRSGTQTLDPSPPECAVGDGDGDPGDPPRPDCGTKAIPSLMLSLQYDALSPDRITLSPDPNPTAPTFTRCPMMGTGWTTFLTSDATRRTAGEKLPRADLFDKRQGKMIVIGRGAISSNAQGIRSTTRIQWDLTLTRLRAAPKG
jgi:hypothetical protein